ncbi:MAG: UDP-N-acetylglucosamine 1-carboxyvinyltransferase [Acidobacteria bacterium]|nr:MAG: UDP-N-acetylglucosamine 1-carboxyvinyltransferase [Acidobacteriota bacterium]RLE22803.1 MAG: UDP-N-acetylglucosamine 1-carboxyvinyltransferase [Acidobacteriota bacterium]
MLDKLVIQGGKRLTGDVRMSGAKNAALPLIAASILSEDGLELENVPDVTDVRTLLKAMERLGAIVEFQAETGKLNLTTSNVRPDEIPYDIVRKMRASVLLMGPLLGRFREAHVYTPGGCAIGARPINEHIHAFQKLGADHRIESGFAILRAPKLRGTQILFDRVTVTGTENAIMAAVMAEGETVIEHAANEPEVVDLCNCLIKMGAKINGVGNSRITIKGVRSLHRISHRVIPDRIEAGTYLMAIAASGGNGTLFAVNPEHLRIPIEKLVEAGVTVIPGKDSISIEAAHGVHPVDVETSPYPGFPTDLQAQFMALMTQAEGVSFVKETIFENRFQHVQELNRLGARLKIDGNRVIIRGGTTLQGAEVMATDLRASASLVIAGLTASGTTNIHHIYHLDRGYHNFEGKLQSLGADIARISE